MNISINTKAYERRMTAHHEYSVNIHKTVMFPARHIQLMVAQKVMHLGGFGKGYRST